MEKIVNKSCYSCKSEFDCMYVTDGEHGTRQYVCSSCYYGVKVFKLDQDAILPTRNKPTDAGLDLYALEGGFIPKGSTKVVRTGVAVEIPPGFVGKIEDRSSMGVRGLRTGAGVIDAGYNGEIGIVLHNLTANTERDSVLFQEGYRIKKGDKIAQILIYKVETPEVVEVKELWKSERGSQGYGSSGR